MRLVALSLLGLVIASPVQAQQANPLEPMSMARVNYVYQFAVGTCPKVIELTSKMDDKKAVGFIGFLANRANMTPQEQSLLYLMCGMYFQGIKLGALPATK